MNTLTLEALRSTGMRVLAGTSLVLATIAAMSALVINGVSGLVPAAVAIALTAYPLMLAGQGRTDGHARQVAAMTIVVLPALLLYVFRGFAWQGDIHMMFFAALAMVLILCDWRAILAGAGVVAVHHLLFGMVLPEWVFAGDASFGRILFHAVVLIVEAATLMWVARGVVALLHAVAAEEQEKLAVQAAGERERERNIAALQNVVSTLGNGLNALANGDLTREITESFPGEYRALQTNYNAAIASLRDLVGFLIAGTRTMRAGVDEIADASEQLARRTESNASSLEETSTAITRMDASLRSSVEVATRTVSSADGAMNTIDEGRSTAEAAVHAMSHVSDSAEGIDAVIEGLDKIAFQTRVLAMNAAVEAGRAGEAGKGFAVVADLVSALAMRAEEEAGRARDQLTTTQSDIQSAVGMVRKVDEALSAIARDVGNVHQLLGTMATDNESQSTAITEISSAVVAMDQSTQQNAAMVEETSAAARQLSTEVVALVDQVSRFNVGDAGNSGERTTEAPRRASRAYAVKVPPAHVAAAAAKVPEGEWATF